MPYNEIVHLNQILRSVRDINRLIIREKDPVKLIQQSCEILTNTRGYFNARIVIIGEKGEIINYASSDFQTDIKQIEKSIFSPNFFTCCSRAFQKNTFTLTNNPIEDCKSCPFSKTEKPHGSFVSPLSIDGANRGLLIASVPIEFVQLGEEQELFKEIASDISYALNSIDSKQKRLISENELKNERFLMDALMENLPENIYFKNKKSEFIRINKSMSRLFGLQSTDEIKGKTDFDFFSDEHAQAAFNDEQNILKTGNPILGAEEKETWPDGKITWVVTTKMPLKDYTGEIIGTFGISRDISKQKEAEIALRESEEKFKMIVQNQGEGIGIINENEEFIFANPAANQIFGIKEGSLINQSLLKFLSKNTIEFIKKETQKRKKGADSKYEIEIIRENGDKRNILVTTTPYKDEDGNFLGTFGVFRDITERVVALETLQAQKEQFELAIAGANDGIWDWNLKTNELFLSPRWKEQLGYSDIELPNNFETFENQLHPEDRKFMVNYVNSYLKGDFSVYDIEFRMRHKDGSYRWMQSKGEALRDKNGKPYRMAGSHSDITDRKLAEKKTEDAFNRLNSIMNSVQAGIILVRKSDQIVVEANPAVEKMLGYKKEEIINKPCRKHICPAQIGKCPVLDLGQTIDNSEREIINSKGERIPILKNVTTIEIEGEEYLVESFVNISQQKDAEKKLIEARKIAELANKTKSEFLANMSHEIRTPMNSILGFSEVLLNTLQDEKHKGYLKTILNSGKTLLSLINDILDLSKIESGKLEINKEPADLRVLIHDVGQIFAQKVLEKNINYITIIDDNFPESVLMDEIRFRQILFNIIGNALKFTLAGFIKIELKLGKKRNGLLDFELSVSDSGIGIPKKDHLRIFDSFSQQSGKASRNFEGTGLGLTICKRLTEMMNGKIELKSKVGVGSTFSLKFSDIEYSEQKIDLTDNYSWTKQNIELNPSTILIVDDVTFNRDLIKSFFDNSNIRFVEAENGENGISEAKFHQPDLILMDIRMPGIDGYTTTRILKKRAETASIPVIALTASTMKSDIKKINQLFNGYLQKPVQKNFLVAELMKHLPYKELKSEDFHKDINPEEKSVEIPISLKEEFKSKFFIQIDEFRETIIVDELEDFIVTINDFAEEKGVLFLKNKIKTLKSDIAEFDLMKINNCLTEIKHFFS